MAKTQSIVFAAAAGRTTTGNSGTIKMPEDVGGIQFILDATTVTGTSPTLDVVYQISRDEGTTWYGVARHAQVTAAASKFMTIPLTTYPSLGVTLTSANFDVAAVAATGGTLVTVLNTPPGFMRALWTIGGTNPNFNFTITANVIAPR